MSHHDLVIALKNLAVELQRTPNRDEFAKHIRQRQIIDEFGGYTALVQAAGLEAPRKKITNKIFEREISKHLEEYEPREIKEKEPLPTIAAISDIHWPFSNERVIKRYLEYVGDTKPEVCVINGDAWDMYSHSKFPRSHNVFTPREEQNKAREQNQKFWLDIQNTCSTTKCYQLLGNHDIRPMKRILEEYPEAEDWIAEKLKELFTFDNVTTIHDPREELIFSNLMIHHGYRSKLGDHRDHTLMNSINGHTHRAGVSFRRIRGETLWELNCGYAGDPESKGLSYTQQKINDWTPGFGAVDRHGPRVICV